MPDKTEELKKLCPGHKSVKDAPYMKDLRERAEKEKRSLYDLVAAEKELLYSATDGQGDVYLIPNPAVWEERRDIENKVIRIKPPPIFYCNAPKEEKARNKF